MKNDNKPSNNQNSKRLTDNEEGTAVAQNDSKEQLSLFDVAPWPDSMRAIPNDYARSALFTVKNKRQPRESYQRKEIYHVNKDVRITYTGLELRADDDELVWQQVL